LKTEQTKRTKRFFTYNRSLKIKKGLYAFFALLLLIPVAVAFLAPTVLTITNSFMDKSEITANYGLIFEDAALGGGYISERVNLKLIPDIVSFSQYNTFLIKSPQYLLKFWNSMILVLPIVVFQILIALGAAYCFARFKSRFRSFVFFFYIILMMMPYQVTLVPNYMVADFLGLLETRWSIILPGIFSPFSVFILTKYMRRIPKAVIEAAKLDGVGEWSMFTRIFVPMSKSTIYSVAILVFIDYWNMVEQPLVLLRATPDLHPLSVFLSQINAGDVGLAFAVATVYMVPTLLLFLYSEDYLIEGISYAGGVKA